MKKLIVGLFFYLFASPSFAQNPNLIACKCFIPNCPIGTVLVAGGAMNAPTGCHCQNYRCVDTQRCPALCLSDCSPKADACIMLCKIPAGFENNPACNSVIY